MGFLRAIVVGLKEKYFCFSGRASRSEHNYFFLFLILVNFVFGLLEYAFFAVVDVLFPINNEGGVFFVLAVFALLNLVFIIPDLAMTSRRLHDMNYSAWWIVINISASFYGLVMSMPPIVDMLAVVTFLSVSRIPLIIYVVLQLLATICILWYYLVLIFKKGTDGENRFGPVAE